MIDDENTVIKVMYGLVKSIPYDIVLKTNIKTKKRTKVITNTIPRREVIYDKQRFEKKIDFDSFVDEFRKCYIEKEESEEESSEEEEDAKKRVRKVISKKIEVEKSENEEEENEDKSEEEFNDEDE